MIYVYFKPPQKVASVRSAYRMDTTEIRFQLLKLKQQKNNTTKSTD